MATLQKLEVALNLTEQAHREIRRYILASTPSAGTRMTETFFAERLGISKSPVREALNSLQNEGLLRIEPRRGVFVHQFSGKEIADLYDLREAVETFAAEVVPINSTLVEELRDSVERTRAFLLSDDKASYIEEDIRFHRMIVETTGNAELVRVHNNLQDKLWLCRCQTYQLTSLDTPSAHTAIMKAFAESDRSGARNATRQHIHFVRDGLKAAVERREMEQAAGATAV